KHRFSYKGLPVPSVTQILKDLGYLSSFYILDLSLAFRHIDPLIWYPSDLDKECEYKCF
ncbi:unnamed protein product, partial [marine sediment metagenome]